MKGALSFTIPINPSSLTTPRGVALMVYQRRLAQQQHNLAKEKADKLGKVKL